VRRSLFPTPTFAIKYAKLLKKYISKKILVRSAITSSMIGDGSYMIFLYQTFSNPKTFQGWLESYKDFGQFDQVLAMGPETIHALQQKSLMLFWIMAAGILGTNLYNYFKFSAGSPKSITFMKQLGVLGALFASITIFEAWDQGIVWFIWMIFMVPLYLYVFFSTLAVDPNLENHTYWN